MFSSHSAGLAGAEQSLVQLVREAASRGHSGTVVLPDLGPLSEKLEQFSDSFQIVVIRNRLWMGRRFNPIVGAFRLLQAISDVPNYVAQLREGNYAVVVVNSSVTPVPLVCARLAKVPALQVVRESLISNPMLRSALPKSIIKNLISRLSTRAICISKFVAAQYGYPAHIVYPQVDPVFLNASSPLPAIPPGTPPRAIMCGTISPEKGQLDALRAIAVARSLGTDISLDFYGHGKPQDVRKLESLIESLKLSDLVKYKGSTKNVIHAYESAHVAVVCSKNEAFGKVTAEAILVGRPVVAYGRGGTSEILEFGGGLTVEPSPEALGAALHKVFSDADLLERLRAEALSSRIREGLSSSAAIMIDSVEELGATRNS